MHWCGAEGTAVLCLVGQLLLVIFFLGPSTGGELFPMLLLIGAVIAAQRNVAPGAVCRVPQLTGSQLQQRRGGPHQMAVVTAGAGGATALAVVVKLVKNYQLSVVVGIETSTSLTSPDSSSAEKARKELQIVAKNLESRLSGHVAQIIVMNAIDEFQPATREECNLNLTVYIAPLSMSSPESVRAFSNLSLEIRNKAKLKLFCVCFASGIPCLPVNPPSQPTMSGAASKVFEPHLMYGFVGPALMTKLLLQSVQQDAGRIVYVICDSHTRWPGCPDEESTTSKKGKGKKVDAATKDHSSTPSPEHAARVLQNRHQLAVQPPALPLPATRPSQPTRSGAQPMLKLPSLASRHILSQLGRACLAPATATLLTGTFSTAVAVHPGWISYATQRPKLLPDAPCRQHHPEKRSFPFRLLHNLFWLFWAWVRLLWSKTPSEAAESIVHCCVTNDLKAGAYYIDCKEQTNQYSDWLSSSDEAKAVWEFSLAMVGEKK